jgi:hypothetical protein
VLYAIKLGKELAPLGLKWMEVAGCQTLPMPCSPTSTLEKN